MNLFSIGAAFGILVAVFQWGWAGSVIGIGLTSPIGPYPRGPVRHPVRGLHGL